MPVLVFHHENLHFMSLNVAFIKFMMICDFIASHHFPDRLLINPVGIGKFISILYSIIMCYVAIWSV